MNRPLTPPGCILRATAKIPDGMGFEHLRAESPSLTNFEKLSVDSYRLEIVITQPDSPDVADGDLHDDLREMFEELVTLQRTFDCQFELAITVGNGHPNPFLLQERVVIILAILQCRICVSTGP